MVFFCRSSAKVTGASTVGGVGEEAAAIEVSGLRKSFGERAAITSVNLVVRPGTIHGLLGPNGAGKTTVLRALLGLVRPDAGQILVSGRVAAHSEPRARLGVAGFVESPAFYPTLSAVRNLELLADWDSAGASNRVEDLLAEVGLADRARSKVRGFSTGMRQRLGLAAALLNDPAVLVVDEPTTGLDPAGIRDLHGLLRKWREAGKTVLLSSHDLDEVEQLCDEVTVLRTGRVVYSGSINTLRDRASQRMYRLRTTDDEAAVALADGANVDIDGHNGQLSMSADEEQVDRFVLRLGRAGVAVRELQREQLSFESLFFQLTEEVAGE